MGVPAFFRWLSRKYVSIIVDAVEERRREVEGIKIPVDCTQPNQNFQEFDNLYLDMNGIIHPCTHPEDRPAPKTEEEMFILIFEYIDRLFSIVRPRKLLYMAIDGVAPRAKMNQQRSRRFRAAKEAAEKREQIAQIRKRLQDEGVPLPPPRKEDEHFDSNCITPGTPFMARLSDALRYYIHRRVTDDPAWKNIQIILSDANVPGEGEHKIMDYIRRQRASPAHDPNTVHCLCGADADLIMLGLATHEANFNIIREEFVPNQPKPCELCGQYGHELEHCEGLAQGEKGPDQADPLKKEKNFIFIRLPVLREYLERELAMPNLPFPYDLERAIDDWVMMCFFVGNDFLPHLPSLEIRENAIDRLVKLYKNMVYQTGGWLTHDGEVNIGRVKMIMVELGKAEDQIFRERQLREQKFKESQRQRRRRAKETAALIMPYGASLIAPQALNAQKQKMSGKEIREKAAEDRQQFATNQAQKLKSLLTPSGAKSSTSLIGTKRKMDQQEEAPSDSPTGPPPAKSFKDERKQHSHGEQQEEQPEEDPTKPKPTIQFTTPSGKPAPLAKGAVGALLANGSDSEDEEPEDEIRLWEAGWKDRYYQAKFQVPESDGAFRRKVACAYVEGLAWVLRYYYQGCASWTWYYPYHYAPFASDFELIDDFQPNFSKTTRPFKPLEQLMGVFPAASRAHIPEAWRWLMTDPNSPIIDFYPENFEIDLNGKKFAWQGVALLPFVDEKRLLSALETVYDQLTPEEQARNMTGPDRLFIGKDHQLFDMVYEVYRQGKAAQNGKEAIEQQKTVETVKLETPMEKFVERTETTTHQAANNQPNEADNSDDEYEDIVTENSNTGPVENEPIEEEENEGEEAEENSKTDTGNNDGNGVKEEDGQGKAINGLIARDDKPWVHIETQKAYGMSGLVSHDNSALDYGVNLVSMFRNSIEFGDIKKNSCIMVEYRDPQFPTHFRFKASRLDGIKELPRVLKPQDYDERRQGAYRPQIGFSRDVPRASLSTAGHRTLGHSIVEQYHQEQQHQWGQQRRSGPPGLFSYQPGPPGQQPVLPWHRQAQQQQQGVPVPLPNMSMPPPLLGFAQMAMPPPPPAAWLQQTRSAPTTVGGAVLGGQPQQQQGYAAHWGQPPPFVQPQQGSGAGGDQTWRQQNNQYGGTSGTSSGQQQQYNRYGDNRNQQQQGGTAGGGGGGHQRPAPYHRNHPQNQQQQPGQQGQSSQQPQQHHHRNSYSSSSSSQPREFRPSNRQH